MKGETKNIIAVIADMVRQPDPELTTRLEYQEEALREIECTYPVIGRWIDAYDVKYLLSTFALGDKDFATKFPAMAHTTEAQRQRLIVAIEAHIDQCKHCSLKRGFDLEIETRIERACQQNKGELLRILNEDEGNATTEGDHLLVPAYSAHQ
jgi:hypothetical protein